MDNLKREQELMTHFQKIVRLFQVESSVLTLLFVGYFILFIVSMTVIISDSGNQAPTMATHTTEGAAPGNSAHFQP